MSEPYSSAVERASEDDRAWFEQHPDASQRIRGYMAGEFGEIVPPLDHRILVQQIQPGVRSRSIVSPNIAEMAERGLAIIDPVTEKLKQGVNMFK
jgi:hypothetical protein